jgi:predicted DNA binding CopG/RHH family protein
MKLDADEKELLESVEGDSRYAKATFRRDRRLNIRLSSKDLEAIQKRARPKGCRIRHSSRVCCTSTRQVG